MKWKGLEAVLRWITVGDYRTFNECRSDRIDDYQKFLDELKTQLKEGGG